jgi:hypothetical protein
MWRIPAVTSLSSGPFSSTRQTPAFSSGRWLSHKPSAYSFASAGLGFAAALAAHDSTKRAAEQTTAWLERAKAEFAEELSRAREDLRRETLARSSMETIQVRGCCCVAKAGGIIKHVAS